MSNIKSIVSTAGIDDQTSQKLIEAFQATFDQAREWEAKAKDIVVTDESQTDLMKQAREARLKLKNIRVQANKVRKALKEDSIRYGRAVQGVYNLIEGLIVPIEKHLEVQEKFKEIQEQKRIQTLRLERNAKIEGLEEYIPSNIDLGTMSEEDFNKLVTGAKMQQKAELEAIERARKQQEEEERLNQLEQRRRMIYAEYRMFWDGANYDFRNMSEKSFNALISKLKKSQQEHIKEQERIKKENERLRKKAEEEERAKKEAEEKLQAIEDQKKAEQQKIQSASDKTKLDFFVRQLENIEYPNFSNQEYNAHITELRLTINNFIRNIHYMTEEG